jgi:hypothetical protein
MKARITLLFIFLAPQAPLTWAQNQIPINITVEDLGDQPCGLTKHEIKGRAKLTLRQYGFTEAENGRPLIYISPIFLELGQQCVGHISVQIQGYTSEDLGDGRMGWVKKAGLRKTVLAYEGVIFSSPRYAFSSMALDSLETHLKKLLGEIEY